MRNSFFSFVALIAACTPDAVATPAPAKGSASTPVASTCSGGDVVYQIDKVDIRRTAGDQTTSSIAVRSSGAWTFDVLDGKRLVRKGSGCLPAARLAELRKHLDGAPWKLTQRDAMCEIYVPVQTVYRVGAHFVWTSASCTTPDILDDKSLAAIAAAGAILGPPVGTRP